MRFVDGRHTRMAIIDSVRTLFERGKINVQQEGRPVMDRASVVQLVPQLVDKVLGFLGARTPGDLRASDLGREADYE